MKLINPKKNKRQKLDATLIWNPIRFLNSGFYILTANHKIGRPYVNKVKPL